jgi:hypothetical protein
MAVMARKEQNLQLSMYSSEWDYKWSYTNSTAFAMQMKLNLLLLEDISDDIDFSFKLAREESVIILPG